MNTKEAIEFCKYMIESNVVKGRDEKYKSIIALLQQETIDWKDKFYELEEEFEKVERELKREIEHWKSKYYNKGV